MARETIQDRAFVTDQRSVFDPADLQDFADLSNRKNREKEEALMVAVLADAVECFQKHLFAISQQEKKLFREAEEWIFENDNDWVFSFDSICEILELSPDYLRQGLARWKAGMYRNRDARARHGTDAKVRANVLKGLGLRDARKARPVPQPFKLAYEGLPKSWRL